MRLLIALVMLLTALAGAPAFAQTSHLAVIVGLAGEPEHGEAFQRWATTLVDAAERLGVERQNLIYLAEQADADPKRITGRSTKEEIKKAFDRIAASAGANDVVFVVLIGHGTFDGKVAKFNLPGPDMTPADFLPLLETLETRHLAFINTASASGPFMEALAGEGRTIVTATRSGSERYATLFGGYFVDALAGMDADADKNKRISVLEAFSWAKREVANAYEREGIMRTENALLNDSGGEGSPDPQPDGKQGKTAAVLSLGTVDATDPLPADPQLRALHQERRDLERRVEALKLMKGAMPADRYASELEKLVTDLALKTRQIRELEKKAPASAGRGDRGRPARARSRP
jgi:NAD(P)-dependent dehydrogenase (short-subunit alcohol dehydrogenase family)